MSTIYVTHPREVVQVYSLIAMRVDLYHVQSDMSLGMHSVNRYLHTSS